MEPEGTNRPVIDKDETPVPPLENYMKHSIKKILHVHGDSLKDRKADIVHGLSHGTNITSIANI